MSSAMGNKKQEQKILRMAEVVHTHAPDTNLLSVKGAFRFAITHALERNKFSSWQDVAGQPATVRQQFFSSVIESAMPHLEKMGLDQATLKKVGSALQKENEAFMKSA